MSLPARLGRAALRHWLALANAFAAVILGLPFLAPVLLRLGHAGAADLIYSAYQLTCHQWPFRTYFLFGPRPLYSIAELQAAGVDSVYRFSGSPSLGYPVAFCERNVAIYGGVLLAGLLYARRPRPGGLSMRAYLLLVAPMGLDGVTQLVGWRESDWGLRTLTGLLFGLAGVWLIYPRVAAVADRLLAARPAPRALEAAPR